MSNGDNAAGEAGGEEAIATLADARAHWSLFLPAACVALLYGVSYLLLAVAGKAEGELARLVLLVLAIAPPLLLAGAFLRYYSTGLAVTEDHILVARGWPRRTGEELPLDAVKAVEVLAGRMQRRFGAGQIRLTLASGRRIVISDLARPDSIAAAISERLKQT